MTFTDPMSGGKVEALKDIQFELKKGEILTVLGPSGCGKTTLLNMIAGFITPTSGSLSLGGVDIESPGAERGMVFQQGALFEWLTVARNVDFGLRMKGRTEADSAEAVEFWLETVGLQGFGNTPTYQLSGGMQQRVALARCLVNDPDLILMDEPLGALDALAAKKCNRSYSNYGRKLAKQCLSLHSVEEVYCWRAFVRNGATAGRIHREYQLPFAEMGLQESLGRSSSRIFSIREEILTMIWDMERGDWAVLEWLRSWCIHRAGRVVGWLLRLWHRSTLASNKRACARIRYSVILTAKGGWFCLMWGICTITCLVLLFVGFARAVFPTAANNYVG